MKYPRMHSPGDTRDCWQLGRKLAWALGWTHSEWERRKTILLCLYMRIMQIMSPADRLYFVSRQFMHASFKTCNRWAALNYRELTPRWHIDILSDLPDWTTQNRAEKYTSVDWVRVRFVWNRPINVRKLFNSFVLCLPWASGRFNSLLGSMHARL